MVEERQVYNLATIRRLLLAAFRAEDLRRFCQDRPVFRPIVDRFGPGHGFDDMVAEVLDYCQAHLLLEQLLEEIKEANPKQYARFEPDLQALETGAAGDEPAAEEGFARCERDLEVLGQKLGDSPARVGNYSRLRDDLKSNWARARADDDEETRARRKLILEALNRLALNTVGQRFGEDGFSPAPSWVGKVVANFAFVGVVGLVVALVSRQMLAEWLACQCPWTLFFGLPVILLSFLHVGWRWRCSRPGTVDAKASLKTVKRELVIAAWIDALHFWRLPAWATYVGALAAALAAVLLFLFLPGPRESTPMVEGYSVRYVASGETVHLTRLEAAEQGVEVQAGASVLITPDVMGDADARCTWYAIKGGRLIPEQGCAARYSAPLHETNDVISILIESECRTCEWWATVRVTIRQP